jgi:hypothetical protein
VPGFFWSGAFSGPLSEGLSKTKPKLIVLIDVLHNNL